MRSMLPLTIISSHNLSQRQQSRLHGSSQPPAVWTTLNITCAMGQVLQISLVAPLVCSNMSGIFRYCLTVI